MTQNLAPRNPSQALFDHLLLSTPLLVAMLATNAERAASAPVLSWVLLLGLFAFGAFAATRSAAEWHRHGMVVLSVWRPTLAWWSWAPKYRAFHWSICAGIIPGIWTCMLLGTASRHVTGRSTSELLQHLTAATPGGLLPRFAESLLLATLVMSFAYGLTLWRARHLSGLR